MKHIKVNLPLNSNVFKNGNGEGCWVLVKGKVKKLHDNNEYGGLYEGILDNDSYYYPSLKAGNKVLFSMRGDKRPVAIIEGFLDEYTPITQEEYLELIKRFSE